MFLPIMFVVAQSCHPDYSIVMSPRAVKSKNLAAAIIFWYDHHRRDLPWRPPSGAPVDPYKVWLSEIMLQQTTVAVVKNRFLSFIRRWPNIAALANAPRGEVMQEWAGLGYYSRARNLHKTAIIIMTDYEGLFPECEHELRRLPGVGLYTAAAIAAIAFGQRALVMDANISRIMARFAAVETPLPKANPELYDVLDALTPHERVGDFAQALMDIGSAICTASSRGGAAKPAPKCLICPLSIACLAKDKNPALYPRTTPKKPRPQRRGEVLVARSDDEKILLVTRSDKGMLGGMEIFPTTGWLDGTPHRKNYLADSDTSLGALIKDLSQAAEIKMLDDEITHIFTHFRLNLRVIVASGVKRENCTYDNGQWHGIDMLKTRALPTVMRKVALAAGVL